MSVRSLLRRVPGARPVRRAVLKRVNPLLVNPYLTYCPPGHYYSPIPAPADVRGQASDVLGPQTTSVPGIDLNVQGQLALLNELRSFAAAQPFTAEPTPERRYHYNNDAFRLQDGLMLYGMLRQVRPKRVIDVGSGYTSAAMLDVDELFLHQSVEFTFIDLDPTRLLSLMRAEDRARHRVLAQPVQAVPLEAFDALQANDVLFIDSSHMGKVGSDVLHLLTHVLPRLKVGVVVHIHDIFWPFAYPSAWFEEGRAWNEGYLVRAFLQFNSGFRILLFNDYLAIHHRAVLREQFPQTLQDTGWSLWLQRVG